MKDIIFLLLTGLLAAYLCWYFYQRYNLNKALHNQYFLMGFAVLLVSGLLLIFIGPFYAKGAPRGFFWVGIGGVLIGLGGIALAFISLGKQWLFFSPNFVMLILTPLLFLMTGAFALGFTKKG